MIPMQYKAIALLVAIIALAGAFFGYGHHQFGKGVQITTDRYETALAKQKAEAATMLAGETAKTRATEQALQAFKNTQELNDANHQKIVADLSDRLRRAAGPAMRLRDPNATPGCWAGGGSAPSQTTSPTDTGPADGTQTAGLLSAELTGLLSKLTREADDINDAYASCKADSIAVRAAQ